MLMFKLKLYEEENEILKLRRHIEIITKYIEKLKEYDKSQSDYELKQLFYTKIKKICEQLSDGNISISLIKIDTIEYLKSNFDELYRIYNEIIRQEEIEKRKIGSEDIDIYYTDIEKNKINAVKEMLVLARKAKENLNIFSNKEIIPKLSSMSKKDRDKFLKDIEITRGKEIRRQMEERIKIFRTSEFDLLREYMTEYIDFNKKEIKNKYIQNLVFMGEFFEEFQLIQRYLKSNNRNLKMAGLQALQCDEKDFRKIFTQEYLSTLTIEKLEYLNATWINRFSKEIEGIAKASFVINDFDLWKDIYQGKELDFSDEELKWELIKITTLTNFLVQSLSERRQKNEENDSESADRDNDLDDENIEYAREIQDKEGEKYRSIYSEKLPKSKNIFIDDIQSFESIYNAVQTSYFLKDKTLVNMLYNLQLNKSIQNWGIMAQEEEGRLLNAKYVLIGIDLRGMNMPIRLHIPKDLLIECTPEINGVKVLPLYAGREDFIIDYSSKNTNSHKSYITSSILKPIESHDKEKMKELLHLRQSNLCLHLGYIYGVIDIPEHLKTEVIKHKKGKRIVKKEFKREYIKVDTKEIINEDELSSLYKGDEQK